MDASLVKDLAYVQNIFPRDFRFNQAAFPDLFEVEVKEDERKVKFALPNGIITKFKHDIQEFAQISSDGKHVALVTKLKGAYTSIEAKIDSVLVFDKKKDFLDLIGDRVYVTLVDEGEKKF